MYTLRKTQFGNPILRSPARRLRADEVRTDATQQLIRDMYAFLESHPKYGVGIAAQQLNVPVAISVISIKPTDYRPNVGPAQLTIINPEITRYYGRKVGMWEGCISFGTSTRNFPYAQTRRHKKIRLRYLDERGEQCEQDFDGILAHVIQHETDHLNGILFVDRVKDTRTYMMKSEYVAWHQTTAHPVKA